MKTSALQFVTSHYTEFKLGALSVTELAGRLKVTKRGNYRLSLLKKKKKAGQDSTSHCEIRLTEALRPSAVL